MRPPALNATITDVHVDDRHIAVTLSDGRTVTVPTSWSRRLLHATDEQRADYRLDELGIEIEWTALDEHIGLWTLLGVPEEYVLQSAGFEVLTEPVSS